MQDDGKKTSENEISVEFLEDFKKKSLFNTLFMMFNSRYQGVTLLKKCNLYPPGEGQIKCTIF